MTFKMIFAATAALLFLPSFAVAGELRHDEKFDVPITILAGSGWIGSELLKSKLGPADCRWCDRDHLNPLDASIRNSLLWSNEGLPDTLSSIDAFVLAPGVALGLDALAASHDGRFRGASVDGLVILEATMLAADLNQIVKFSVGRERPFVRALPSDQRPMTAHPDDNNTSFFSGHTTLAFSLAVSSGTVASLRGYSWAPLVWGAGLTVATTTAYFRLAADRHYFTDVAVGAIVGSAVGFGVPYFFHGDRSSGMPSSVNLAAGGKRADVPMMRFAWIF